MIATLLLTLQLAVVAPSVQGGNVPASGGATLVVRNASRSQVVPLVATNTGPMLRPEWLAPVVPASVHREPAGSYSVLVFGVAMRFEPGVAAVRVGSEVRQLASAPVVREGHLLVPMQFVAEVLPAIAPNLRWDAASRQLVAFSMPSAGTAHPVLASRNFQRGDGTALAQRNAHKQQRVVVVDAGHGGPDNGMTGPIAGGPRIYEKNVTLAVAKRLGEELRERGVGVVFTRTSDTLIALSDRGRLANQAEGDLFISIHVNAANMRWKDPGAARGFETYFLSEARTEDARRVEQMENEAVRFESGRAVSRDDPLGFILSDMAQNEHLRESSELAAIIQRRLRDVEPGPDRGVKQAGFRVLVTAYMPAVLVEIGFGTNRSEAEFLSSPESQRQIATAIADAAIEYLQRYERRVSGLNQ